MGYRKGRSQGQTGSVRRVDRLSSDVRESPVTPRRVEFAMHEHGDVMSHKLIKRGGKFGIHADICVQKNHMAPTGNICVICA